MSIASNRSPSCTDYTVLWKTRRANSGPTRAAVGAPGTAPTIGIRHNGRKPYIVLLFRPAPVLEAH